MTTTIDNHAIRAMVEDFWRAFLVVAQSNPDIAKQTMANFEARIHATSSLMPADQASVFLTTIDAEREILFQEYLRGPDVLKQRLGLPPTTTVTPTIVIHQHGRRQGLAETAVKAAVRATVWQTISSIFRW